VDATYQPVDKLTKNASHDRDEVIARDYRLLLDDLASLAERIKHLIRVGAEFGAPRNRACRLRGRAQAKRAASVVPISMSERRIIKRLAQMFPIWQVSIHQTAEPFIMTAHQ
jgi:hypothetical protein